MPSAWMTQCLGKETNSSQFLWVSRRSDRRNATRGARTDGMARRYPLAGRHRPFAAIIVEAALSFPSEPARFDIFHQQRTGPVFGVGEPFVKHLHDRETGVETDEVGKLKRPHGMM